MSEKQEIIFVGNGIEKFGGNLISVTINLDNLRAARKHELTQDGHGFFEYNGVNYVKLNVQKNKTGKPNEYDKTHYVAIDTWKPDAQKAAIKAAQPRAFDTPNQATPPANKADEFDDDIPF
jgi:uncharacterized membrane protein YqiK